MSECAYCNTDFKVRKRSKEHVIPDWFYRENPKGISFNERNRLKTTDSEELVIRDVCTTCNNGPLSLLDDYGKFLYNKYFRYFLFNGETISFSYDYSKLAKWLLKISYNSSRVNRSDNDILGQCKSAILKADIEVPESIMIFLSITTPTKIISQNDVRMAMRFEQDLAEPDYFRVGVARFKGLSGLHWAMRTVIIQSFKFVLFIPDLNNADLPNDNRRIHDHISQINSIGVKLKPSGEITTSLPVSHMIEDYRWHALNNEISIKRYFDNFSDGDTEPDPARLMAQIHEKNFKSVKFIIDRKSIEEMDFESILPSLMVYVSSRENLIQFWAKVDISVFGYDDDPRELFFIPEVRAYLKELNNLFPYWLALQPPDGKWIKVLYFCLSDVEQVGNKQYSIKNQDLETLFNNWFYGLNELSDNFAISISKNREQSELIKPIIFG